MEAVVAKPSSTSAANRYWNERATTYSNGVRDEMGDDRRQSWSEALRANLVGIRAARAKQSGDSFRVLDLGCGPGFFSILLAELGCRVEAVDLSPNMLEEARLNVLNAGWAHTVTLHQGDVGKLPFEDGVFDLVASRNVTWLLSNPRETYQEWLRVLAPGGRLLTFDAEWYRYLVDDAVNAQRAIDQADASVLGWDSDSRATDDQEHRCEQIAASLPLTRLRRPAWDQKVLAELGASRVFSDTEIWRDLWTLGEKAYYGSSPLFLVGAEK